MRKYLILKKEKLLATVYCKDDDLHVEAKDFGLINAGLICVPNGEAEEGLNPLDCNTHILFEPVVVFRDGILCEWQFKNRPIEALRNWLREAENRVAILLCLQGLELFLIGLFAIIYIVNG
jgi:hypothetical protein